MKIFTGKIALFFTAFSMVFGAFFTPLFHGGWKACFENWSKEQPFTRDYAVELEKDPDRDFVILNLTDIQLGDSALGTEGEMVKRNIDRLVDAAKPDLITVSGDNAVSMFSYIQTIKWLDSYGIPWAPVMGNHDGQGCPTEFWCAYDFTQAENCLFKFGPRGMGYGNYILNITENGEIIHTLFMMDTHSDVEKDNINGRAADDGYDHLWENQFDWYSWAVDGIRAVAGKPVESTVIFHIPLYEYRTAFEEAIGEATWTDWTENHDLPFVGAYAETSFGSCHEFPCSANQNNGFFALLQEKGSTKNVLCGHDHVNDFSILYEGIRLTYGVKTGSGSYWESAKNGGTTLTVGSDGHASVQQIYLDFYAD